jgi:hypothetical protein
MSERGEGGGGGGLPAAPRAIPGLPENAHPYELSEFRTLNRQVSRASINDEDMAWCHNMAPIGTNYLRATPSNDAPIYDTDDSSPGQRIIWFDFWIDPSDVIYSIVFLDDGSAQQINVDTEAVMQVAPAGTFSNVVDSPPAMVQTGLAGSIVVLIISPQTNAVDPDDGYFIWDGTNLFRAGTLSPATTIQDGGNNYTSAPGVSAYGGSGAGAVITADVDLGSVSQIHVVDPGSGYLATDSVILLFSGGGQGDSAVGIGNTDDGVITSLTLVSGGSGFTTVPSIVITPVGGGAGASAVVTGISGGIITSVKMLDGGAGYGAGAIVTTSGGGGSGADLEAVIEDGVVTSVTMVNVGSGYSSPPDVVYHSTSGAGASGTAVVMGGQVTGVRFDFPSQGGFGYQTPPIVQFVGGGGPAAATIEIMPFGIVGNAIETYVGRVWIDDGNRIFFTAPQSLVDFGNGGGVFQSQDSFLRNRYRRLKQGNGFLYLLGDSSVNYISGVQTGPISSTDVTPITTFSNLNLDPQIGTSWFSSVTVFSRQILFGNASGVFSIAGGAIQKISAIIDKIFYEPPPDIPGTLLGYLPSAAVTRLFSTDTLVFLTAVFNPFTQTQQPIFLMWNGKRWWTADQNAGILLVNNYEKESDNQAYGTDGHRLYKLLINQSATLTRIVQSKLWLRPSILIQKRAWGIFALFECYDDTVLNFTIDTETGSFNVTQGAFAHAGGSLEVPAIAFARSSVPAPSGVTIGFTMRSSSKDFALLTALLIAQEYSLLT